MAELGFVGDGPNSYQLWLGGTPAQTRLAEPFQERMKIQVSQFSSSAISYLGLRSHKKGKSIQALWYEKLAKVK